MPSTCLGWGTEGRKAEKRAHRAPSPSLSCPQPQIITCKYQKKKGFAKKDSIENLYWAREMKTGVRSDTGVTSFSGLCVYLLLFSFKCWQDGSQACQSEFNPQDLVKVRENRALRVVCHSTQASSNSHHIQ